MSSVGCVGSLTNGIDNVDTVVRSIEGLNKGAKFVTAVAGFIDAIIVKIGVIWEQFCEHLASMAQLMDILVLISYVSKFLKNKFKNMADRIYTIFFTIFRVLFGLFFIEKFGFAKLTRWGNIMGKFPAFWMTFNIASLGIGISKTISECIEAKDRTMRASRNDWMCENAPKKIREAICNPQKIRETLSNSYVDGPAKLFKESEIQRTVHQFSANRELLSSKNITVRRWEFGLTIADAAMKALVSVLVILGYAGVTLAGLSLAFTGPVIVSLCLVIAAIGLVQAILRVKYENKLSDFQESDEMKKFAKSEEGKKIAKEIRDAIAAEVKTLGLQHDADYKIRIKSAEGPDAAPV